jgi:hypothetical protein
MTNTAARPRFKVDFSEAALDGLVSVMPGSIELEIGQSVGLYDEDGNTATGEVAKLDKHVVWITPHLDRISLAPLDADAVLGALLRTPPSKDR